MVGNFTSGVVVITTEHDGIRNGMTVSAVSSLSHSTLVDALERADLPAVQDVIESHNEHAKATQRAGIVRHGGRL